MAGVLALTNPATSTNPAAAMPPSMPKTTALVARPHSPQRARARVPAPCASRHGRRRVRFRLRRLRQTAVPARCPAPAPPRQNPHPNSASGTTKPKGNASPHFHSRAARTVESPRAWYISSAGKCSPPRTRRSGEPPAFVVTPKKYHSTTAHKPFPAHKPNTPAAFLLSTATTARLVRKARLAEQQANKVRAKVRFLKTPTHCSAGRSTKAPLTARALGIPQGPAAARNR